MRATGWKFVILAAFASAALAAPSAAQSLEPAKVSNEVRLFQRVIEDGAVTENVRLEGLFRYQNLADADVFSVGPLVSINVAEDFELGGRLNLSTVDPPMGGRETGFTDLDLYGKVRLSTEPTQTSLGILMKLPTGDQNKSLFLGTGKLDVAFFGGVRHTFGRMAFVGSAGLRINQDPDLSLPNNVRGPQGQTSVQLGGGYLLAFTTHLTGIAEASFETERIDGLGSDFRVTLGADYRQSDAYSFRLGVSTGGGRAAPDFELIASTAFYF